MRPFEVRRSGGSSDRSRVRWVSCCGWSEVCTLISFWRGRRILIFRVLLFLGEDLEPSSGSVCGTFSCGGEPTCRRRLHFLRWWLLRRPRLRRLDGGILLRGQR